MSIIRSGKTVTTGGSLTLTVPSGTPADAAVWSWLLHDDSAVTLSAVAEGWTEVYRIAASGQQMVAALYRRTLAASPPESYVFAAADHSGGDFKGVIVTLDRDGGSIDALTHSTGRTETTGATATTNAVTGVENPSTLLGFWCSDSAYTTTTPPSGMDLLQADNSGASTINVYSQVNAGTGSLTRALEYSGSDAWACILALAEETAGAGGGSAIAAIAHHYRMLQGVG